MAKLDDTRPGARREDLECELHPLGSLGEYTFVVVVSEYNGRLMLSRHRRRATWETQGGHIEPGETPAEAAARELSEESGAVEFTLTPVCDYRGWNSFGTSNGCLFHAKITRCGDMPESEMAETALFDGIPPELTYPKVTPALIIAARGHTDGSGGIEI